MTGGRYLTYFPDDEKRKLRIFLYKLENLGIVKLGREKEKKKGLYNHKWELTKKGKEMVEKDEDFLHLWKKGKVIEFYNSIKSSLKEE